MRQLALGLLIIAACLSCSVESPQEALPAPSQSIPTLTTPPHLKDDYRRASHYDISLWLAQTIRVNATAYNIPLPIAFALVRAESNFKPNALSWAGARGLIQVMPETGKLHCSLEPYQLFFPRLNLNCGYSYLAMMYSKFGDWNLALIAYNRGPSRLSYELSTGRNHGTSVPYARGILSHAALN